MQQSGDVNDQREHDIENEVKANAGFQSNRKWRQYDRNKHKQQFAHS